MSCFFRALRFIEIRGPDSVLFVTSWTYDGWTESTATWMTGRGTEMVFEAADGRSDLAQSIFGG